MTLSRQVPSVPARTVKLTESVARLIVDQIVAGDLPPGAPLLPEAEMAQSYGVSRGTIREALRILEANGLVRIRAGRSGGPEVGEADAVSFGRTLTWFLQMRRTQFWELVEARVIVEPLMARLAATRADETALGQLREVLQAQDDVDPREGNAYLAATQEFHSLLAGMSGNRVLDLFGQALKEIYTSRVMVFERRPARRDAVMSEHSAVVRAIVAGEGEKAEETMRVHMVRLAEGFERQYATMRDELIGWW